VETTEAAAQEAFQEAFQESRHERLQESLQEKFQGPPKGTPTEQRQQWLRTLSCSTESELTDLLGEVDAAVTELRKPEIGLAMVTARVGATGEPFGLGEMTITRCVVQVGNALGVGYVRGRAPQHARCVAVADGLLQGDLHDEILARVIEPLAVRQRERSASRAAKVASTKVQFLTMVRGS
jgi:alpha-D-ribose 1-methylphosphonate 5-triphosphate synthase subunit PhnG